MKKTLLLALLFSITLIVLLLDTNATTANSGLPPISHAGAPLDNSGLTCASSGCHSGSVVTQTAGVISHNIPATGFIGGVTYSFSVTMSGSSAYGFEMTPQSATSNLGLGSWIAGVGTAVSTKYIRQSAKGTGAVKTWAFQWVAPVSATEVTFYGAFNYANNNGSSSGDVIKTSSITVLANTTGVKENVNNESVISVFPNPTNENLHITSPHVFNNGFIYNINGKLIKTISEQELLAKTIFVSELSEGLYYLQLFSNDKTYKSKFFKN